MRRRMLVLVLVLVFGLIASAGSALAQSNRIDTVTPSAPELAVYGKYAIGVRTLQGDTLEIAPCIPDDWPGFRPNWRVPGST